MAIKIVLTGDDKSLTDALKRAATKVRQLGDEYDKAGDKAGEAGEEAKKGATKAEQAAMRQMAFAKRLVRQNETAEQTYRRQLRALITARRENTITAQQYRQTVDRLKQRMRGIGDEARRAKTQTSGLFDTAKVATFAASFLSISTAINVVTQALEHFNQEKERALDIADSVEEGNRRLAQISGGDAQEYQRLVTTADQIQTATGMTANEARNFVFATASGGLDRGQTFQAAELVPLIGAEAATNVAKTRTLLGGGDVTQIADVLSAAAAESDSDFAQIQRGLAIAGEATRKFSLEEQAGMLSVLSAQFKSADTAGNRVKALFAKTGNLKMFEGMTALQTLDQVQTLREAFDQDPSSDMGDFFKKNFSGSVEIMGLVNVLPQVRELMGGRIAELYDTSAASQQGRALTGQLRAAMFADTPQGRLNQARMERLRQAALEEQDFRDEMGLPAERMESAELAARRSASTQMGRFLQSARFLRGDQSPEGRAEALTRTGALGDALAGEAGNIPSFFGELKRNPLNAFNVLGQQWAKQNEISNERVVEVLQSIDNKLDTQPLQPSEQQGQ